MRKDDDTHILASEGSPKPNGKHAWGHYLRTKQAGEKPDETREPEDAESAEE